MMLHVRSRTRHLQYLHAVSVPFVEHQSSQSAVLESPASVDVHGCSSCAATERRRNFRCRL